MDSRSKHACEECLHTSDGSGDASATEGLGHSELKDYALCRTPYRVHGLERGGGRGGSASGAVSQLTLNSLNQRSSS